MLLIGHVIRYHRKSQPAKKHKKFRRLADRYQQIVRVLAGLLRIAIGLDRTKSQLVEAVSCQIEGQTLKIEGVGHGDLQLEMWAAEGDRHLLTEALAYEISIEAVSKQR